MFNALILEYGDDATGAHYAEKKRQRQHQLGPLEGSGSGDP